MANSSSTRKSQEFACAIASSWQFSVWINRPEQAPLLRAAEHEHATARARSTRGASLAPWHQLIAAGATVSVAPLTRFGIDPFDDDASGEYRCPNGHVAGLAILSELFVTGDTWAGSDFAITNVCVGVAEGVLRPSPLMLISRRLWRVLEANDVSGYEVEVAHLV